MGGKHDIAHVVNEAKHKQNMDLPQSLAEFTWRKEIFLFLPFKNEIHPKMLQTTDDFTI